MRCAHASELPTTSLHRLRRSHSAPTTAWDSSQTLNLRACVVRSWQALSTPFFRALLTRSSTVLLGLYPVFSAAFSAACWLVSPQRFACSKYTTVYMSALRLRSPQVVISTCSVVSGESDGLGLGLATPSRWRTGSPLEPALANHSRLRTHSGMAVAMALAVIMAVIIAP